MIDGAILKWLLMILVGALSGTLAARIMKGDSFGFIVNCLLGIAGAIVGGFIFDKFHINVGSGIVRIVHSQFGVVLPENFIGMLVSATVGAIIILKLSQFIGVGRKK